MTGRKRGQSTEMAIKILFAEDLEIPLIQPAQMLGQKSLSLRAEGSKGCDIGFHGSGGGVSQKSLKWTPSKKSPETRYYRVSNKRKGAWEDQEISA
jgi:hypothetical protein